MRKLLILAVLLVALGTPAVASFLVDPPVDCPMNYEPVRCSDGQVYANTCHAAAAGATGCTPVPFWEW